VNIALFLKSPSHHLNTTHHSYNIIAIIITIIIIPAYSWLANNNIHHTIQILLGKQIKINTVEKSAARELIDTYIQKEKEYKSIFVYLYTFK
jgi:hypothetical protein